MSALKCVESSHHRLWIALFAAALFAAVHASGQKPRQMPCTAENLDFNLAPEPGANGEDARAHLLVITIRNRGSESCILPIANLQQPTGGPTPSIGSGVTRKDTSESGTLFSDRSGRLDPGEQVHSVIAWSSIPEKYWSYDEDDCPTADDLTLNLQGSQMPTFEVRHLWMRKCGPVWISPYRLGPYTADESISAEWLDRFGLKQEEVVPVFALQSDDMKNSPQVSLRTSSHVIYLKSTFESGYSGFYVLWLRTQAPLSRGCPIESIRKRDAGGRTILYLDHCARIKNSDTLPRGSEVNISLNDLGLLPTEVGDLEYDTVSALPGGSGPALVRAELNLDVRDPTHPTLPAIDTALAKCGAGQLKVMPPPIDLGDHWKNPFQFAGAGQEWRGGRVFQVTNVSSESCLLGGTPDLSFESYPAAAKGRQLSFGPCQNCGNDLFAPRESRWIELKPNLAAHFIATVTVTDATHFPFYCNTIGGIELKLPDGLMELPFETYTCESVDVSAWREGAYDSDPLNLAYDKREQENEAQRTASLKPPPTDCAKVISEDTGRPVMFPSHGGLQWGYSTRSARYGEPIWAVEWIDNPTDSPRDAWTCTGVDSYLNAAFDIFDSAGNRVLSRFEEQHKTDPGNEGTQRRPRSLRFRGCDNRDPVLATIPPLVIPPHTCMHATFTDRRNGLAERLDQEYNLSPGRYFLRPSLSSDDGSPVSQPMPVSSDGLELIVKPE
jgi:hypothetical protein